MFILYVRKVIVYYNLLSTNEMAIENFNSRGRCSNHNPKVFKN